MLSLCKNRGQSTCKERAADRNSDPVLEQKRPHLIDDGRTLDDEPPTDSVEGLQFELFDGLQGDASHAGAATGFRDRRRVVEVVLVGLEIRCHELRRQNADLVSRPREDPTPILRAGTRASVATMHRGTVTAYAASCARFSLCATRSRLVHPNRSDKTNSSRGRSRRLLALASWLLLSVSRLPAIVREEGQTIPLRRSVEERNLIQYGVTLVQKARVCEDLGLKEPCLRNDE